MISKRYQTLGLIIHTVAYFDSRNICFECLRVALSTPIHHLHHISHYGSFWSFFLLLPRPPVSHFCWRLYHCVTTRITRIFISGLFPRYPPVSSLIPQFLNISEPPHSTFWIFLNLTLWLFCVYLGNLVPLVSCSYWTFASFIFEHSFIVCGLSVLQSQFWSLAV